MKKTKTDFAMMREVQKAYAPPPPTEEENEIDCRVSPNVGDLMSLALAAAGGYVIRMGGQTACETDYLAAANATFPKDIPIEELEEFNRKTLKPVMDESDEMKRYAAIANFFKRKAVA